MSSSSSSNRGHSHGHSNIYELDAAFTMNQGSYDYWTDSQHYHYDHHDYHEIQGMNQPSYGILPLHSQDMSASMMYHQQPTDYSNSHTMQGLQGLNGPGIPGNPRLPIAQSDFFQRMHMLSQSSSESDEDNDFDPPFATSLPRNNDYLQQHHNSMNTSSSSSTAMFEPITTSSTVVAMTSLPGTGHVLIDPIKTSTVVINSNRITSSSNRISATGDPNTAIIIHTPMFKSTRDENGKYHETRKNCQICKKRINTFCRDCRVAICFSDGKDPNAVTCWEKHHNNIAISALADQAKLR